MLLNGYAEVRLNRFGVCETWENCYMRHGEHIGTERFLMEQG